MTPDQAEALATATLAAIDAFQYKFVGVKGVAVKHFDADRERVASDLAGLRDCWTDYGTVRLGDEQHADRYAAGLRRTGSLYGVTE